MESKNPKEYVIDVPHHFSGVHVNTVVEMANEKVRQGETGIALDFARTESIDSRGIGQLVGIAKALREKGAQLRLKNLNEEVNRLFKETGLDQLFAIEGQKQDVVDIFGASVDIRLKIDFEELGDVCVLKLEGVMDHIGGSRFFRQQFLLSLGKFSRILVDLTELTFFDSLSVGTLLDMHKLLSKTGGELKMCGANFLIEDLFTTLNLTAVIPYFPTRTEALAGWK